MPKHKVFNFLPRFTEITPLHWKDCHEGGGSRGSGGGLGALAWFSTQRKWKQEKWNATGNLATSVRCGNIDTDECDAETAEVLCGQNKAEMPV